MAVAFVAAGTWTAGTTSIAPPLPAGMAAGHLMLLAVHTPNQAVTTPSGWTQVTSSPVSTGTAGAAGGTRLTMYYRWWQSGDGAPTVAVTGGTSTQARIFGFSGVDSTTPFDATPVSNIVTPANTTLTFSSITTTTADAMIVCMAARDVDAASTAALSSWTNTNLTSLTERQDQTVTTGPGGGLGGATGFKATAGATGSTTATQTSSIACCLTIALRNKTDVTLALTGSQVAAQAGTMTPVVPGGYIVQSAYVADDSSNYSATIAASLSGVTAGNAIVACFGFGDSTGAVNVSNVTDNSNGMSSSSIGKIHDTGNTQSGALYYRANVESGSHTITATFDTTTPYRRIRVFEIGGVATSSIEDRSTGQTQSNVGTTTDSISSGATSATTNANDFILGITQDTGNTDPGTGTMSAGTGFTLSGSNQILSAEYKNVSSTGAQAATFTDSKNSSRITYVIALKNAASGGSTIALTGSQVAAQAGTVVASQAVSKALTGSQVAAQAGTVTASQAVSKTLTGSQVAAQAGSVSVVASKALTGSQVAAQAGSVSPSQSTGDVTVGLTGSQVVAQAGIVVSSQVVSRALSGSQVAVSSGSLGPNQLIPVTRSVALSGSRVTVLGGNLSVSPSSQYPSPSNVRVGTKYGPTGVEFTGTMSDSGYSRGRIVNG